MSRSGYDDDCSGAELNLWRGAVDRAIRGKRGQAFLREMLEALDAMPEKRLASSVLVDQETGECCAMGAVALKRGLDTSAVDPGDRVEVSALFGIAESMAAEIAFENDDDFGETTTPERRWEYMRAWTVRHLAEVL